jgi:hypothetical protein
MKRAAPLARDGPFPSMPFGALRLAPGLGL